MTINISGVPVNLTVELEPEVYGTYVVCENGRKLLYIQVLIALYGMMVSSMLWYKTFRSDIET